MKGGGEKRRFVIASRLDSGKKKPFPGGTRCPAAHRSIAIISVFPRAEKQYSKRHAFPR